MIKRNSCLLLPVPMRFTTCVAVHFAVCHALYNNKNKKIGKNRCLVFFNDLVLFCSMILSLYLLCLMNQGRTKGEGWSTTN